MNISIYIGKKETLKDQALLALFEKLENAGCSMQILYEGDVLENTPDMLLSVGGDGSFLSASRLVAERGIPVMGVNAGRLGFLSENRASDIASA
jgi:NAD+ kinase